MKMTQTPLANKIKILAYIHLDYRDADDNDLTDFVEFYEEPDTKDSFAMALSVFVGYATPTERGIEIIDELFDDVCERFGIIEDTFITDISELY